MPRSVTVTFADGSSFMYDDVPDTVTPNQVEERATRDFPDRQIVEVFGGDRMVSEMREAIASGQATMDDLRGIAQRYNRDIENPEAAQYWLDYAADNPGAEIPENIARPPVGRMEATLSGIERNLRPFGEFAEKLNPLSYVTDLVEDLIAPGRRQERETAIENRLAADAARAEAQRPNWFAGGQIAGDVIGTAPAIFMGGAGLAGAGGALAARAPTAGRILQNFGRAVQTGGAGVRAPGQATVATAPVAATRGGRIALRTAGGAASGVGSAALTGQDLSDAALTGAAFPLAATVARRGAGGTYDFLRGRIGDTRAAEVLRNLFAENSAAIMDALRNAPADARANTAQWLAERGLLTPELAAATRIVASTSEGAPLAATAARRAEGQNLMREQLRGGATGTEAMQNIGAMRQNVRNVTDPMREENLWLADVGRMEILPAERQAANADALAAEINNSGFVRRMRGLEGRSQEQMDAVFQYPEFFTPGRTVERIGEVTEQAGRRADEAIEAQLALRGEAEAQRAIAANLRAQGLQPLDISGVVGRLRQLAADAQDVNPPRYRLLSEFANNLENRAARMGGIDATGLYELRKSMGDTIADLLGPGDPSALQRRTAELVGEITPLIDDAIEEAGGTGWRQYLNTFAAGMRNVERQEFARALERLTPQRFEQVMSGNDPKFVSDFFGPGRYDISAELFGAQLPVASRLAREIGADLDVASSGLRDIPQTGRGPLAMGASNRVRDMLEPGMNMMGRLLFRAPNAIPGASAAVNATNIEQAIANRMARSTTRSLAPALADPSEAFRLAQLQSGNAMLRGAIDRLDPFVQALGAQAAQQYLRAGPLPAPAQGAEPNTSGIYVRLRGDPNFY